jgi:hypothetical protein
LSAKPLRTFSKVFTSTIFGQSLQSRSSGPSGLFILFRWFGPFETSAAEIGVKSLFSTKHKNGIAVGPEFSYFF